MRKVKQIVIPLTALLLIGAIQEVKAQADWNTLGNTITGTDFLGTNNNEPLNFKTNGAQRLRITPTGFVGIGTTNPLSLLHLKSATTGEMFRTDGKADAVNLWRMYTGGREKFRLSVPSGSDNVHFRVNQNADMILETNSTPRLFLKKNGRLGLGISTPQSLFHLHINANVSVVNRFTNLITNATESDGSTLGISSNGSFQLKQYETKNVDILTPGSNLIPIPRFRIQPNGQVFVGNELMAENVIDGGGGGNFGLSALLNVRGPINSCADLSSNNNQPTILYSNTSPNDGIPGGDGFRMHLNLNFKDTNTFYDALVFEKTDFNDLAPDGYIAFTNTGKDSVERISAYFDGHGRFYVGDSIIRPLTNRVTIDSDVSDATPSGLRFIDLTSTAIPEQNPGKGVLGVDINGNVIYVNATTDETVGNYCGSTANPLLDNFEVPLNDHNYYFTGNTNFEANNIGFGIPCSSPLIAKIDVHQMGSFDLQSGETYSLAGQFLADKENTDANVGLYTEAGNGNINYGIVASIGWAPTVASSSSGWAGYFLGPVFASHYSYSPSDISLKQNIESYQNANALLTQLHPVSYDYRVSEFPQLQLEQGNQIGLIAQELERVLPNAVREVESPPIFNDSIGASYPTVNFKAVSYEKLIPILVAGHQEQQTKIEDLETKLNDLMTRYEVLEECLQSSFPDLCSVRNSQILPTSSEAQEQLQKSIDVKLSSKNNIILNQNVPNPFAEKTVISYSIPETIGKAQILFYDAKGNLIQTVDVQERGTGQLNVFGTDLSSGMYSYTLVADGKIVDTKRLVKN